MNKENTNKLYRDFPKLYSQHLLPLNRTCMCWGFECGDGWFDLIYELSSNISKYTEITAVQVKEKYGALRYYTNYCNNEVDALINKAEELSEKTCEVCGKLGVLFEEEGWYKCRCGECYGA